VEWSERRQPGADMERCASIGYCRAAANNHILGPSSATGRLHDPAMDRPNYKSVRPEHEKPFMFFERTFTTYVSLHGWAFFIGLVGTANY
jgi:hypothetical protein